MYDLKFYTLPLKKHYLDLHSVLFFSSQEFSSHISRFVRTMELGRISALEIMIARELRLDLEMI